MKGNPRGAQFPVWSVSLAAFVATLDSFIVNISLPTIAATFRVGIGEVAGVVLGYLLFLTGAMLVCGKLADRWGYKRLFLTGHAVFLIGSTLCGLSATVGLLVASRCLQGTGAAMLTVSAYSLIAGGVPKEQQGRAYGILATAAALGMTAGPPLGGFLSGYFSWRWIFLVNIPVGLAGILWAARTLPAVSPRSPRPRGGFDVMGAGTSFAAVLLLIFALNRGGDMGWKSLPTLAAFAGSLAFLATFLGLESRREDPLLDVNLLRNPASASTMGCAVLALMALAGNGFLVPFYLVRFQGLASAQAGWVMLVYSIGYLAVAPVAGRMADRVNPKALCLSAMVLASGAFAAYALALPARGLRATLIFLAWLGLAYGLFITPNNKLVLGGAPPGRAGEVSGLFSLLTRLAMVLGVSVCEAIYSQVLHGGRGGHAPPPVTADSMAGAFRVTYLFAALVCAAGALLSVCGWRKNAREIPNAPGVPFGPAGGGIP